MIEAVEAGASRRSVAIRYKVGVSTVIRLMQRWKRTGSCSADPMGGIKPYLLDGHAELVDQLLTGHCDATLEELRLALAAKDVKVSITAVDRYLKARGYTRKKRQRMPPSRSERMSPPRANSGETGSRG
jgi:transposase